jgi:hypothetical protein
MKNLKFHGVTSIIFAGIAIALAAAATFQAAVWLGAAYFLVCAVAAVIVIYAYCAKCPCKAHCAHILPGKAAMLFKRRPGPYSTIELAAMSVSLLLLVVIPQAALWQNPDLLIAFWFLLGIAVIQVRGVVCRACNNTFCPLRIKEDLQ